jgi:hypothetical protein
VRTPKRPGATQTPNACTTPTLERPRDLDLFASNNLLAISAATVALVHKVVVNFDWGTRSIYPAERLTQAVPAQPKPQSW